MNDYIYQLYVQENDSRNLDFDNDPSYRRYYHQAQLFWGSQDIPDPIFRLLDTSNFLSFSHGLRLGARLALWALSER